MTCGPTDSIAERLVSTAAELAAAARACGRTPDEITLIAVSKRHDTAAIRAAYAAGQRDFGESYAAEWAGKAAELADLSDLRWHFVGHLQRNKMRHLAGRVALLHGIDSLAGVAELSRRAERFGRQQPILLQINLSGEASKSGCTVAEAPQLAAAALSAPGLRLDGLMTMPPAVADPELARPFFARLSALRQRLRAELLAPDDERLTCLSMGMSADFAVAIAEGATHVRVGTAIFGDRPR